MRGLVFFILLLACTVVQSAEVMEAIGTMAAKERPPSARPATLQVFTVPGRPGETCVVLVDAQNTPLVRQCTYGHVWTTSASPTATLVRL